MYQPRPADDPSGAFWPSDIERVLAEQIARTRAFRMTRGERQVSLRKQFELLRGEFEALAMAFSSSRSSRLNWVSRLALSQTMRARGGQTDTPLRAI